MCDKLSFVKMNDFLVPFMCNRDLNKPSGSNGARHQLGASLRKGPSPGELNVQAYKVNKLLD